MPDDAARLGPAGRVLAMEGVANFRDYGGYAAGEGARIVGGVLWRSGQHVDATPADLGVIAGLGLTTVIDLRGDSERAAFPCARPDQFAAEVIFAAGETSRVKQAAFHAEAARTVTTVEEVQAATIASYSRLPWRPTLIAAMRLYLSALAQRSGPSLLHCVAGKDRTGIAVAFLHHLLGVHADDIMADYLLTNTATTIEQRMAIMGASMRALGAPGDETVLRALLSVDSAYLEAALAAIRERHGSLDGYFDEVLGVTPELRRGLRERLLV